MAKPLSYQRLEREMCSDDDNVREHVISGLRNSTPRFRKVHMKRKLRIKQFPGRSTRKPSFLKMAWSKLCIRFKECQSHFGELFGGNYLFLRVTPTMPDSKSADNGRLFVKNV
ncbi:uncharacterized protein LOC127242069 [Andrographis paniculata]|uniref:uncharacterized protein LOC127242069 n=1 Tax=Andrographis paniculata TaxID=175694 RepID=UPI0021E8C160|nr:uncharacterized protein LOC127242069 [Andrographis paniculata]